MGLSPPLVFVPASHPITFGEASRIEAFVIGVHDALILLGYRPPPGPTPPVLHLMPAAGGCYGQNFYKGMDIWELRECINTYEYIRLKHCTPVLPCLNNICTVAQNVTLSLEMHPPSGSTHAPIETGFTTGPSPGGRFVVVEAAVAWALGVTMPPWTENVRIHSAVNYGASPFEALFLENDLSSSLPGFVGWNVRAVSLGINGVLSEASPEQREMRAMFAARRDAAPPSSAARRALPRSEAPESMASAAVAPSTIRRALLREETKESLTSAAVATSTPTPAAGAPLAAECYEDDGAAVLVERDLGSSSERFTPSGARAALPGSTSIMFSRGVADLLERSILSDAAAATVNDARSPAPNIQRHRLGSLSVSRLLPRGGLAQIYPPPPIPALLVGLATVLEALPLSPPMGQQAYMSPTSPLLGEGGGGGAAAVTAPYGCASAEPGTPTPCQVGSPVWTLEADLLAAEPVPLHSVAIFPSLQQQLPPPAGVKRVRDPPSALGAVAIDLTIDVDLTRESQDGPRPALPRKRVRQALLTDFSFCLAAPAGPFSFPVSNGPHELPSPALASAAVTLGRIN